MPTIRKKDGIFTLINVFTVAPGQQDRLVDLLVDATERTMKNLPGFVSASIHRGADGRRVVNYAQWRSRGDFEAMRANPEAKTHMQAAAAIATFDPIACEVAESVEA